MHSTHRKFSCETCLSTPVSFANEIDDEISIKKKPLPSQFTADNSREVPASRSQLDDVLTHHTDSIQKMLDKYQTSTIHALETSFVSAIEKLSSVQSSYRSSDQQDQINQLLRDKDTLMREKDNLVKRINATQTESLNSASKQELQTVKRQIEECCKERDELKESLHNSMTDSEIAKSKLEMNKTVLRQKLDAMSSRNEILNNELVRLEKLVSVKNENVVDLENSNRDLKGKIDKLQSEVLSWKSHASRADDSLLIGHSDSSPIIINDSKGSISEGKETYSSAAKSGNKTIQRSASATSDQSDQQRSSATSDSAPKQRQENSQESTSPENHKEKIILIGTSNVRYLNSRYIAGDKFYVRKEIKYTVSEAKGYIESLQDDEKVSKFVLHLSCNDIKLVSPADHANSYCDLVTLIRDKYPRTQVIVSLGLPRKDTTLNNKIEVANAMIKERLFKVQDVVLCDNSNLSYRGRPASGVLEEDGIHVSRRGVFILNQNFRSCVYGSLVETEPRRFQTYRSGYNLQRYNRGFSGRRMTGYYKRFGDDRSRR